MVFNVKFLIFAHGNVIRGDEGASYDKDPVRKIRLKTDASYEDLLAAICKGVDIDPTSHQIKVQHRLRQSLEGRTNYYLVPILDDGDVEDLVQIAEKMGEGFIQELFIEISDGPITLSEHLTQQEDATMPSNSLSTPQGQVHFSNFSSHHNGGDGDQTSGASSSSTPLSRHNYDVFLSFRGKDTRYEFTDHLYRRLDYTGISAFRDKEALPVGERNWPEIVQAIKASKISIPIISLNYASSEWCLKELVEILKCNETSGQHVKPIFYKVPPSDVREQKGDFGKAFQLLKENPNFSGALVKEWEDALMKVSCFTGWESEKTADKYEGQLVEIVVAEVSRALKKSTVLVSDDLIGVEDHVKKIMNMANVEGSNDARAILIHGMGGIGKTTLAKVVYNQLTHQFECCSYLANIRETSSQHRGKEDLQKQLISNILGRERSLDVENVDKGVEIIRDGFEKKKVLVLLDDVNHRDQLNAFAGKRDWFGRGSLLIITSRRNDILKEWEEGSFLYELNGLNDDQSFLLFCKHAFKERATIRNEYQAIAKKIVSTTCGLPLAIEVIGCFLRDKKQYIWEENLRRYLMMM